MFDHIRFFNYAVNSSAEDVKNHKDYQMFASRYKDSVATDSDYRIQGSSRFLMSRPLPEKYLQNLLYVQSFCYMDMGASYFTERKNYTSFLLLFTYEGKGSLSYDGQEYTLQEGDIFLIDCRKYHYYRTLQDNWKHSDLHIWGRFAEFFYQENMRGRSPVFHCRQTEVFQQQLERILRFQTTDDSKWALMVSHEIESLLFLLLEWDHPAQAEQIPKELSMLRIYLENHFQDAISLDEMARFSGISKYHLCRQFKKYIGFSPKEYVLDLRISHAKLLLQTSNIPSHNICTLVGFSNEANFIRHFKNAVGMTPGQYRKQFTVIDGYSSAE